MPERIEEVTMKDLALIDELAATICRILASDKEIKATMSRPKGFMEMIKLSAQLKISMERAGVPRREMLMAAASMIGTMVTKVSDERKSKGCERN